MKVRIGNLGIVIVSVAVMCMSIGTSWAQKEAPAVYPMAIFPFVERGSCVKGYGEKAADILFAKLAARSELILVERAEIKRILGETELNLSGIVTPAQATKVGKLTGAKILLTGSVFEVDKKLYVVAKIIGTETSRVLGKSVVGRIDELG